MNERDKISIVIAAHNEEKNILPLYKAIQGALDYLDYEIIFVNDGSTDKTLEQIQKIKNKRVKIINFKHRKGKSYAWYRAFTSAKYKIIATLDADLQNDPKDILSLLEKIDQGYDFVCGWRYKRQDSFSKKIFSRGGNILINFLLKTDLHDNDCPLKIFRKECIERIKFFNTYHRFITPLAKIQGFKICEVKISHYPRRYGKSKYGILDRVFGNLRTLLIIKFKKEKLFKKV